MIDTVIVVPCYNEAERLDLARFRLALAEDATTTLLFVDDGSTDPTAEVLTGFCAGDHGAAEQRQLLRLPHNQGKAEAVRQGLLTALELGPRYVGFWDADLATPLADVAEFRDVLETQPAIEWVFGSRVRLLGRHIERVRIRHYLGRIWATGVSLLLGLPIYDTQCGAKLFRASPELAELLREPFITRWVFDVELIARLIVSRRRTGQPSAEAVIYELPLRQWSDVAGSKLRPRDFWRSGLDLVRIYWRYLSR